MSTSVNQALQELDQLIQAQQWQQARPHAEALTQRAPTAVGVIERAGLVLQQLGDWPALIDLLLQGRNRYHLWPLGSDLMMGRAMVELGEWSKAIPYLELAQEQEKNVGWAQHFLGKALRHTGRLEEALALQQQASALLPEFAWAPFEASQLLVELKQPRLAVLELQEARRRQGDSNPVMEEQWQRLQPVVLHDRVEQLAASGDHMEAFALLRQALQQAPEDEGLNQLLMQLLLAQEEPNGTASADLAGLEEELKAIESLLDQLETQLDHQKALADSELSYL